MAGGDGSVGGFGSGEGALGFRTYLGFGCDAEGEEKGAETTWVSLTRVGVGAMDGAQEGQVGGGVRTGAWV